MIRSCMKFRCSGKKGEVVLAQAICPALFRAQELVATDSEDGHITTIKHYVLGKSSHPIDMPTVGFGENSLGGGVSWGTIDKGLIVVFAVEFHKDGEWWAELQGQALR